MPLSIWGTSRTIVTRTELSIFSEDVCTLTRAFSIANPLDPLPKFGNAVTEILLGEQAFQPGRTHQDRWVGADLDAASGAGWNEVAERAMSPFYTNPAASILKNSRGGLTGQS